MIYVVLHYKNEKDLQPQVIHRTNSNRKSNTLKHGVLNLTYNGVDTLDFTIDAENSLYNGITALKSIIEVINGVTRKTIFKGRILKPKTTLSGGVHTQTYIAESLLGYLNDSVQTYGKIKNTGVADYFRMIINRHNAQVESHKQFKIGHITMTSQSDVPFRYLDYGKTLDVIKEFVVGNIGGVIRVRYEPDGNYIDWLSEYGQTKTTKLKPTDNLLTAYRETNFDKIITRLMPLGAVIDSNNTEPNDSNATHERLTIRVVNDGSDYLEDKALVEQFGIIEGTQDWSDIDDASILKARGLQYLETQKSILTSWETEVVEMAWISNRYEFIEVGNLHPIDDEFIGPVEVLKVVGKSIDLLTPEKVKLTIGDTIQTLKGYQNQTREAIKSIQRVQHQRRLDMAKQNELDAKLEALQRELAQANTASKIEDLKRQIQVLQNGGN